MFLFHIVYLNVVRPFLFGFQIYCFICILVEILIEMEQ